MNVLTETRLPYEESSSSQNLQVLRRQFAIPRACQGIFVSPHDLPCSRSDYLDALERRIFGDGTNACMGMLRDELRVAATPA